MTIKALSRIKIASVESNLEETAGSKAILDLQERRANHKINAKKASKAGDKEAVSKHNEAVIKLTKQINSLLSKQRDKPAKRSPLRAAVETADVNTDAAIKTILARVKATVGISKINKARTGRQVGYTVLTKKANGKIHVLKQILVANGFKQTVNKLQFGSFVKAVNLEGSKYLVQVQLVSGIPDIVTACFMLEKNN